MLKRIKVDRRLKLFIIHGETSTFTLGFQECARITEALAGELGVDAMLEGMKIGTRRYGELYCALLAVAKRKNEEEGWRSFSGLSPQLSGLEGVRVEVVSLSGEKRRFIVGKSTGYIPCHIERARSNSSGGPAAERRYASVKIITKGK